MTKRECKRLVEFVLAVHRQARSPVLSDNVCEVVDIACQMQRIHERRNKFALASRDVDKAVRLLARASTLAEALGARLDVRPDSLDEPVALRFGSALVVVPCF